MDSLTQGLARKRFEPGAVCEYGFGLRTRAIHRKDISRVATCDCVDCACRKLATVERAPPKLSALRLANQFSKPNGRVW
jgi:Zn ribbon nucleic-acid-binding protein